MNIHVFHYSSRDSKTILVKAESEVEARGKAQKKSVTKNIPPYRGTIEEVMNMTEGDVLDIDEL